MTLTELWKLLDQLEKAFLGISLFVIVIGFLTILISLYMSLNERQREMAILRSVGVSVREITTLLFVEALLLSLFGAILGFVLQYGALTLLGLLLKRSIHFMYLYQRQLLESFLSLVPSFCLVDYLDLFLQLKLIESH